MPNNGGGDITAPRKYVPISFNNIYTNNKTVNIVTADAGVYYCVLLSLRTFSTSPNAMVCITQTPSPPSGLATPSSHSTQALPDPPPHLRHQREQPSRPNPSVNNIDRKLIVSLRAGLYARHQRQRPPIRRLALLQY